MYCKKCGKKIPENSRFCDRCGQPTFQAPTQKRRQSSGDTERIRHTDSYDRYRKQQMRHNSERRRRQRRTRIITLWVIIFAFIVAIGAGFGSYYFMMNDLNKSKTGESAATATPAALTTATPGVSENPSDDYNIYNDTTYKFKIPYPSNFEKATIAGNNTRLSLKDSAGDGEMLIGCEKISETKTPSVLLKDYVKGIGTTADYNRAGDNWYSVSYTRNGKVIHRKAMIVNKTNLVYYDFTYNSNSENVEEYKKHIEYIDNYMTDDEKDSSSTAKPTAKATAKATKSTQIADEEDD